MQTVNMPETFLSDCGCVWAEVGYHDAGQAEWWWTARYRDVPARGLGVFRHAALMGEWDRHGEFFLFAVPVVGIAPLTVNMDRGGGLRAEEATLAQGYSDITVNVVRLGQVNVPPGEPAPGVLGQPGG